MPPDLLGIFVAAGLIVVLFILLGCVRHDSRHGRR